VLTLNFRMYPEQETYGPWPRSGEVDIAQVRGNNAATYENGRDTVSSALHWGPSIYLDQSARAFGKLTLRRQDLAAGFHTYGIEWSETHLFAWIDDRVYQMLSTGFGVSWGGDMYQRGGFQNMWSNGQL
jgi:beta-glucanase (GH16 family)